MIFSILKIAIPALFAVLVLGYEADAQKKTPRKTSTKKPASATKLIPPLEVRAAREKVEIQLENVDRFIVEYAPKADALELLDAAYATKKVSEARLARHADNKKNINQTIRNLRLGLAALESEFRTKGSLAKYLPQVEGITDLVIRAEDLALGQKFVAAKGPLRDVSKQLTECLGAMPK